MTVPKLETPQKPAAASPAMSPAEQGHHNAAMNGGTENSGELFCPESTPAPEAGHEQLSGPPKQQAGGRKLVQKRLDWQQAIPVSLNSPGAAKRPAAKECDGRHLAILTQLELQDEEVCSTSCSQAAD